MLQFELPRDAPGSLVRGAPTFGNLNLRRPERICPRLGVVCRIGVCGDSAVAGMLAYSVSPTDKAKESVVKCTEDLFNIYFFQVVALLHVLQHIFKA